MTLRPLYLYDEAYRWRLEKLAWHFDRVGGGIHSFDEGTGSDHEHTTHVVDFKFNANSISNMNIRRFDDGR